MHNKFSKGLLLGGLLAAGAILGLTATKKGKKLTEDLQKDVKALMKELKTKLADYEDVTRENFNQLVTAAVDQYSATKKLAGDSKEVLQEALEEKWEEMEEEVKKTKK